MKKNCKRLTMLLLVFAIVAATASFPITAKAVDLSQPCSLTVNPGSSEFTAEFEEAGVVVDLYKVADATEAAGSNSYTYSFSGAYSSMQISDSPDNSEWRTLSQKAAEIAFNGDSPVVSGAPSSSDIRNLSAGLYLVVVRGQGVENYITTVKDENGKERVATVAYSQSHVYTFSPELVSLPAKQADENGSMNTANPGDWLYDVTITMKPEQDVRFGSLEIVKTLLSFDTSAPATFVFDIQAELDGKIVYSNVVSLTFASAGVQSCQINGLPVGSIVTVTEIYSGACYTLTTDASQLTVISEGEIASVSFTNDYDGRMIQGGSINNRFDYSADDGWSWTPIFDYES